MKNVIKKAWPLVVAAVLAVALLIFYGVTLSKDNNPGITEENLADGATVYGSAGAGMAFDSGRMTAWNVSEKGAEAVVDFGQEREINALLLNETGYNVKQFSVYYENGGEWELCYRQCEIGVDRLATFYPVTTKKIKVVIDDFKNTVRISDIAVYNLQARENSDFRVSTYIRPEHIGQGLIDPDCFDIVTDVQFIAYGNFDPEGNVVPGEGADEALEGLKDMIGNRDVSITVTVFPVREGATMADVYRDHMDNAVQSIVKLVEELDVDGADFDWEYPRGSEEWALYSEFIVRLGEELHKTGKELSIALSPWGVNLSQEAVDSIDQLQIMAYDMFDYKGDNNSYSGATACAAEYFISCGFAPEQLNLGISFYGRPNDGSGVWVNYRDENYTQDEYIMYQNGVWFNTVTTVRDKTAYAALRGLGGIMIFSQDEDLPVSDPLSLTAQIGKAIDMFVKEA